MSPPHAPQNAVLGGSSPMDVWSLTDDLWLLDGSGLVLQAGASHPNAIPSLPLRNALNGKH